MPAAQRGETRCYQGRITHPGTDKRPRGYQARRGRVRWRAHLCWSRGGYITTRRERPRRCWTTRVRERALYFRAGGISRADGQDVYSWKIKALVNVAGGIAKLVRIADLTTRWKRAGDLCQRYPMDCRAGQQPRRGESQGLPVWSRHAGDPILKSNLTRRVDFALFMVGAGSGTTLLSTKPQRLSAARRPRRAGHTAGLISREKPAGDGFVAAYHQTATVDSTTAAGTIIHTVRGDFSLPAKSSNDVAPIAPSLAIACTGSG